MKKVLMVVGMGILIPGILKAIPSYARKHNLACTTCHYAPGYLSDFGQSYKLNGYRTEAEIGGINNETQDKISDLLILGNTFPIGARVKSYVYKKFKGMTEENLKYPMRQRYGSQAGFTRIYQSGLNLNTKKENLE